jgi:phosphoglycolate phosphatase-like HAD superfamily hydrolase
MKDTVIFDLDGTLADISHRLHYIEGPDKDWDAFFKACVHDEPINTIIGILQEMAAGEYRIVIMTGRSDAVLDETMEWLNAWAPIGQDFELFMRKEGDHTPDDALKLKWLNEGYIDKDRIFCVFEDRKRVVDMWRGLGLTCLQVAPGDF